MLQAQPGMGMAGRRMLTCASVDAVAQDTPEATLSSTSTPTNYHVIVAVSAGSTEAWDGQVRGRLATRSRRLSG